ncbi:hypothetical protein VNO77_02731 [Canavalia gladiata]|uniref:Uncharacterized protein n=1 Tax=Canavalia gladiata TaxID=3824 RepID=A0AAN9R668_CANGL
MFGNHILKELAPTQGLYMNVLDPSNCLIDAKDVESSGLHSHLVQAMKESFRIGTTCNGCNLSAHKHRRKAPLNMRSDAFLGYVSGGGSGRREDLHHRFECIYGWRVHVVMANGCVVVPVGLKLIAAQRHTVPMVALVGSPGVVSQNLKLKVVKWEVVEAFLAREILLFKKHDFFPACKICQVAFVRFVTYITLLRIRICPTSKVYRELSLSALLLGWPMSLIVHGRCLLRSRKISSSLAKESRGWRKLLRSHAEHMQVMKPQSLSIDGCYLVDLASSHMLVSKIKLCVLCIGCLVLSANDLLLALTSQVMPLALFEPEEEYQKEKERSLTGTSGEKRHSIAIGSWQKWRLKLL